MSYLKNAAGQFLYFTLVSKTDGSAVTSGTVTGYRSLDGGSQTAVTGTIAHKGNGQWQLALSQADTNGDEIGFLFTHASAVPVSVCVVTDGKKVSSLNDLSSTAVQAAAAAALSSYDPPTKAEMDAGLSGVSAPTSAEVAGAVWGTAVPGAYGAGSAGNVVGNRLDTAVSSRSDFDPASDQVEVGAVAVLAARAFADELLARGVDNVEDLADPDSLTALVLATLESSVAGSVWTIRKTDGSTFATRTVTTDPDAEPITGVA